MAKVSLRAYNREIEAMIDRSHLDEAIAHCKHILKSFPKHLDTYRLLGKAYLEYKRYPDAADIFSRVLVAVPTDFVSHVGMSIIRDEENKLDDAIWHMERAFETQPSNAAIQSELQRLYGRRDGVQLPRIRMTHGALAHMYVKGELYPQAISEIKSVLKEDPGRNDMQVLLAHAYYRSGAKNDAAEAASALLRTEPYSFDANRILVEILGTDHPENVQAYRQRVIELDPYAAQVSGSIFLIDEVPDVAVSVERLDWNGQPVGLQPDWETKQAISLETGQRSEEEPDWLRNTFSETPPLVGQTPVSPFDAAPPPAGPANDIPDFLKAAGWGQSTGAFDEGKSAFAESEPASNESAIAPGDLPDWVKAMAPEQHPAESPTQEEELPDWINKIDKSILPTSSESADQPDWMSQLEQPSAQASEGQPDWLKQLDSAQQPGVSSDEQPDWLKGFEKESASSVPSTGELDWLSTLGQESKPAETPSNEFDFLNQPAGTSETPASTGELDWLSQLDDAPKPLGTSSNELDFLNPSVEETQPTKTIPSSEEFDFLKELDTKPEATPAAVTDDFDFLKELANETEQVAPTSTPEPSMQDHLGMSSAEQDDSFAWLESLAAKQGATEGLLTKPEERLEEEPDWVKQAKGMDAHAGQPPAEQAPVAQPTGHLEELGKTEKERDDSFAWLESLAAKQGATEGLLTKPEERLEEEPEWVKQAKEVSAEQLSVQEPSSPIEDTAAWLRSLDEEETRPSPEPASAKDDTAMWFKSLDASSQDVSPQPVQDTQPEALPDWMQNIEEDKASETVFNIPVSDIPAGTSQQEAVQDTQSEDLPAWMQGIEEDKASETKFNIPVGDIAAAVPEQEAVQDTQSEDLPAWMQGIEEDKASETDLNIPALDSTADTSEKEPVVDTEWMSAIEQESVMESAAAEQEVVKTPAEELPSWLSELDQEQEQMVTPTATDADLPAWLRDETGEVVAEPIRIEPTRASDWHPVETKEPEPEVQRSEPEPEPVVFRAEPQPPHPEPEPVMTQVEVQASQPEAADVISMIEEKIAAVQEPIAPPPPPRERKLKGTGKLSMPLDPILGQARGELSGSNLSGALGNYARLIKKGRFLDEVIYDLRDALYRFPVDVNVWQSLGDAYMRANRLQDALDAYTKAEELLR